MALKTNAGEGVARRKPSFTGAATRKPVWMLLKQSEEGTAMWSSDSISGYACVKNKNSDSKRYMSNVHWSFTYNKPEWKQCDCLLTDDWLKTMWCMYDFNNHVRVWELDHKEGWVPKNWCVLTVVLEKTIDSSLDTKETKPVNPKGNQPWIFIGRIDAEDPILWPSDAKSELIGKDLDARKDCG